MVLFYMQMKKEPTVIGATDENNVLVSWSDAYSVGIRSIDDQHMELVKLTNELYQACRSGSGELGSVFKDSMSRMVEYVTFHFTAELDLLKRIQFPDYRGHKEQHDQLTKKILEASKDYGSGKKFVPNQFVRTLKDWVFEHIAISDKMYAAYVRDQYKKGLLTNQIING